MEKTLIVRYGEISLKGKNRAYFENRLVRNIKMMLKVELGKLDVYKKHGRIYVDFGDYDEEDVIEIVTKVFGVVSVSVAYIFDVDMDEVCKVALKHAEECIELDGIKTFKVEAKRGDKTFKMKSPEIAKHVGGYVLTNLEDRVTVDVRRPDLAINVEIRDKAYVFSRKIYGFGGMPYGTGGKAMLLLSGGIDSPVAGWMVAKRGVEITGVHYHSYPFTSERAAEKVEDLGKILAKYTGRLKLFSVNLLDIQKEINEKCPASQMTVLSRRFMMKIAERLAEHEKCQALVTGESIGQVASQTLESLTVTNDAVVMPVFRPLIAMDKTDIIEVARDIDTFETSIQPFEDCCTVFLPDRPVTKPKLDIMLASEALLDVEGLIEDAISKATVEVLHYD